MVDVLFVGLVVWLVEAVAFLFVVIVAALRSE